MSDITQANPEFISPKPALAWVTAALHYDFCPWANRWVYWLKNPLWVLVLAVVAATICGFWLNASVFLVAGTLMAVLALGIAWPWLSMRGVHCELTFSQQRAREGESISAVLRVQNRLWWPVWGLVLSGDVTGNGAPGDDGQPELFSLARVPGRTTSVFHWNFVPARRGLCPMSVPRMATRFPFGLYRAGKTVAVEKRLIVWPRTVALHSLPDAAEVEPRDEHLSERHVGDQGEILGTRGFRYGDSLRKIHWSQSARHQRLIVSERQAPSTCAVTVDVNLQACAFVDCDGECLEQVIRVAASICESLHRLHASVDCRIGSEHFRLGSAAQGLSRLLDFLAAVPRGGIEAAVSGTASEKPLHSRLTILVTTDRDVASRHANHLNCPAQRLIVVRAPQLRCEQVHEPVAGCRPWIEVDSVCDLAGVLPNRWRRACHAH
ncbi:MAG: DUF58 domain-containing protein [Planctomycetes bacterium]|nr:DUF58 domain-containing protein [Planctomycetota bacterium]